MECTERVSACDSPAHSPEPWAGNYFVSTYPPFSQWSPNEIPHVERVLSQRGPRPQPNCGTGDSPVRNLRGALLNGAIAVQSVASPAPPSGLYVHVPFCVKRCDYCYYLSYADKSAVQHREYVDALLAELTLYRQTPALAERELSFVYFGGGTPSLLDEATIRSLMEGAQKLFSWHSVEEVTFECAPRSVTESKLRVLREAGVTRLSLGVQTFDDEVLRLNGRVHMQSDVDRAYEQIRRVSFDIVNLDLIVGLPGESDASLERDLNRVITMAPESVTLYQLEIPHNTPLLQAVRRGEPPAPLPSWPAKRARLACAFARLEAAGYTVRSAYAAVRDPVRHRFVYQDAQYHGADLLGIGLSSFSYLAGIHFQNKTDYAEYIASVGKGERPLLRAHRLDADERLVRGFVLQLKLGWVDSVYFAEKFGADVLERFKEPLRRCAEQGWLTMDSSGVRLTRDGLVRIDRLLPAFYQARHRDVRYS